MPSDFEPQAARRAALAENLHTDGVPLIMGIVNITEDSFYAGSRADEHEAVTRGLAMWDAGATWVDIGGESTRPGASSVSIAEERDRVIPVVKELRKRRPDGLISIDTRHHEVASAALEAGADMVNDVSGLRDPKMRDVVVESGCAVCVMHMQGEPGNMQSNPTYDHCVEEVTAFLHNTHKALVERGHPPELICLDPGIGFGKTQAHNVELLRAGRSLAVEQEGSLLWGVSRKSIVGHLTGQTNPDERLSGTLGLATVAFRLGIDLVRVHDVREHADLFATLETFSSNAETAD
ncbi:MAG: dihydropteroate synthase [Candidatus Poseidonia sp.]|nr:dihydropteroate synthase [Poseidonia sp.]